MPILQYVCKNCKKQFDYLVRKYDDPVLCPDCKGETVRSYSGDIFSSTGKPTKKCSGNCKTCSGCK